MTEPPADCRTMPSNVVNEWNVNALLQCLFPDLNYGKKEYSASLLTVRNTEQNVLTFSMVYRESDSLQCYLFWSGQTHRFRPQDVAQTETVFDDIFCTKSMINRKKASKFGEKNGAFLRMHEGRMLLKRLRTMITDTKFAYFRKMGQNRAH